MVVMIEQIRCHFRVQPSFLFSIIG
jgi:hypothetical protein